MEVIDGGFGKKEADNGAALKKILEEHGCFESSMGFIVLMHTDNGLSMAGSGLDQAEVISTLAMAQQMLVYSMLGGGVDGSESS